MEQITPNRLQSKEVKFIIDEYGAEHVPETIPAHNAEAYNLLIVSNELNDAGTQMVTTSRVFTMTVNMWERTRAVNKTAKNYNAHVLAILHDPTQAEKPKRTRTKKVEA